MDLAIQNVLSSASIREAHGHFYALRGLFPIDRAALVNIIERAWFSLGYRVVSVNSWWVDSWCDDDPSDQDYLFYYVTPAPVSNPDGLRVFSADLLVDAMLAWYQLWYGGVNGFGVTEYNFAKICLGDTGVAMGGGAGRVAAYMKLLQP